MPSTVGINATIEPSDTLSAYMSDPVWVRRLSCWRKRSRCLTKNGTSFTRIRPTRHRTIDIKGHRNMLGVGIDARH